MTTLRDARIEHIYLDLLARNQLAGIIVLYPMAQIPKLNELAGKVPVISIGDKPGSYHFDAVVLDSKKPAMMIAEHLLSLGHTHFAYVTTPVHGQEVGRIRRLAGIRQCLEEHGLPEDHLEILSTSRRNSQNIRAIGPNIRTAMTEPSKHCKMVLPPPHLSVIMI